MDASNCEGRKVIFVSINENSLTPLELIRGRKPLSKSQLYASLGESTGLSKISQRRECVFEAYARDVKGAVTNGQVGYVNITRPSVADSKDEQETSRRPHLMNSRPAKRVLPVNRSKGPYLFRSVCGK